MLINGVDIVNHQTQVVFARALKMNTRTLGTSAMLNYINHRYECRNPISFLSKQLADVLDKTGRKQTVVGVKQH